MTPIREQEYSSKEHSVHGFIDAIHHIDNEIHLIDYKTNASFDVKDSIKLQLAIYSLMYQEKHGIMPSKAGIFFLRHKLKLIPIDEDLIEFARTEINSVHAYTSQTDQIENYPQTLGPYCKWSSGECDFCQVCKPVLNGKVNGNEKNRT
jgi:CRISPR/Cas system-associated exonuclease Cas4 (RecB family)